MLAIRTIKSTCRVLSPNSHMCSAIKKHVKTQSEQVRLRYSYNNHTKERQQNVGQFDPTMEITCQAMGTDAVFFFYTQLPPSRRHNMGFQVMCHLWTFRVTVWVSL